VVSPPSGRRWLPCRDGGQGDAAVQRAADGGGAELGEGGQCSVPADGLEEPGLGLIPAVHVFSRFERFLYRQRRPAMVMK
jgi:hypothetical protein